MSYQTEQDFLASIRASYAISATGELWYAMTRLAEYYIQQDWTQTASDILAFVLLQEHVPHNTYEQADELLDNLERSICPRVIWDAKAFASGVNLAKMIDYILVQQTEDDTS